VTLLVLVILALMWAAVLLPPLIRNRAEGRLADSITSFRNQLDVLERATPHGELIERAGDASRLTLAEAQRRRRTILLTLGAATLLSLALAAAGGSTALWAMGGVSAVLLVLYAALLARARHIAAERASKVLFLPSAATRRPSAEPEPAMLLRRSGS
jgi:hypothetical protein